MALVVTIIIIIILSTVTINMAFGDNGLIKQAQLAKDMTANVIVSENEDTNRVMQEFANVMADDGEGGETIPPAELGTVEDVLKAGNWVRYPSTQGDIDCVVLYDSSSEYGVEIIAMESVEDIELGNGTGSVQTQNTTYFNMAMNSYNGAIKTLNDAAGDYNNGAYSSRARCVGSDPANKNSEATDYFSSDYEYMKQYNGMFKNGDGNYNEDRFQMKDLGIEYYDKDYWLASRGIISENENQTYFGIVYTRKSDEIISTAVGNNICSINYANGISSDSETYGLRPVFVRQVKFCERSMREQNFITLEN